MISTNVELAAYFRKLCLAHKEQPLFFDLHPKLGTAAFNSLKKENYPILILDELSENLFKTVTTAMVEHEQITFSVYYHVDVAEFNKTNEAFDKSRKIAKDFITRILNDHEDDVNIEITKITLDAASINNNMWGTEVTMSVRLRLIQYNEDVWQD